MASPPPVPPSPHAEGGGASAGTTAVCCMCGDQGLPGELVRCRSCRVRLQHRYCSDLYPRAAAYRRCNWCLREPAAASDQGRRAVVAANKQAEERRKAGSGSGSSSASDEERRQRQRQRHEACSSRRTPAEPGHPVKKKHKADHQEKMPPPSPPTPKKHKADQEKMPPPPPPPPAPAKEIIADASGGKEGMRAGKARVSRVKVRRYKLLAEVISC